MKNHLLSVLLLGTLSSTLCACVHAEPVTGAVMLQDVTKPLNTATMDDYLLDLARSMKVNVLADATDFPLKSAVQPYPSTLEAITAQKGEYRHLWGRIFIAVLGEFTAEKKLSLLRSDSRTFLFWSEPDPQQMFDLEWAITEASEAERFAESVAAAKAEDVPDEQIVRGRLSQARLHQVLTDYLKNQHGWTRSGNANNSKVDLRTQFDELPPALRALVLIDVRHQMAGWAEYSKKRFWDTADAKLHAEKQGDTTTLTIRYLMPDERNDGKRQASIVLAVLDNPIVSVDVPASLTPDAPPAPVQLGAKDTLFNAYSGLAADASDPSLDADPSLQRAISLQVKRLSLRDLLAQVQKQSGVRLSLGKEAPATKLVTARVEKMPLSKVMGLLSRVYGVKWSKGQGANYVMRGNDQGELHLKLLQMGDPDQYRYSFDMLNRINRKNERLSVGRGVVQQVGLEALQTPDGIAVSTLPRPLQQRLWRVVDEEGAEEQARSLYRTNRMLVTQLVKKGLVLRFGNPISTPKGTSSMFSDSPPNFLNFSVLTDDGRFVPVFESFLEQMPQPSERPVPVRPPSRRR